mmetsp:Transcript_13451/g.32902  ORF Transcript_13451/g.32902 Transcript_13451/m.32902 type:complete len:231 (-) Transcript_13451:474-1166(-)
MHQWVCWAQPRARRCSPHSPQAPAAQYPPPLLLPPHHPAAGSPAAQTPLACCSHQTGCLPACSSSLQQAPRAAARDAHAPQLPCWCPAASGCPARAPGWLRAQLLPPRGAAHGAGGGPRRRCCWPWWAATCRTWGWGSAPRAPCRARPCWCPRRRHAARRLCCWGAWCACCWCPGKSTASRVLACRCPRLYHQHLCCLCGSCPTHQHPNCSACRGQQHSTLLQTHLLRQL